MWLIQYAVFGLVAGAIARLLHPGRDPMNWIWTMLLGVGGAVVGGFAARQLGFNPDVSSWTSWIAAIGGAIVLLVGYHMLTAPAARTAPAGGRATGDDYKRAVMDDLSRGPNG